MGKFRLTLHSCIILTCGIAAIALFSSRIIEIPWRSALRGWDSSFYLMWVRSAIIDGDIHFQNELEENNTISFNDREFIENIQPTETGYIPNKYGIGWSIMSLPFFAGADSLVLLLRSIGIESVNRDGYNFIYQVFLMFGQLLYAMAGWLYAYRILRFFFDPQTSRTAVAATWGCSLLLYYQTIRLGITHNLVFSLTAFINYHSVLLWKTECKGSLRSILGILVGGGLLAVTRYPSIVFLLFPAVALLRHIFLNKLEALKEIAISLPVGLIPVGLQLVAWKIIYGRFLVNSYAEGGESFNWSNPAIWEVMFDPKHGLFYWHPFLLISFSGLIIWALSSRSFVLLWLFSVLGILYINASWWCWWFAASFGSRGFDAGVLFLMGGTAFILNKLRPYPVLEKCFLLISQFFVLWNIYIVILYALSLIARQEPVTWGEMLRAVLP